MAEISTPPAATASAVLRRALEMLDGRDVTAAIRAAAGKPALADAAFRALAEFCGYGSCAHAASNIGHWQDSTAEHEIRRILPAAADHAEQEGR